MAAVAGANTEKLAPEDYILNLLATKVEEVESEALAAELQVPHQTIVGAIKSLESDTPAYVKSDVKSRNVWKLTADGEDVATNGSPEYLTWKLLEKGGLEKDAVIAALTKDKAENGLKNGLATKIIEMKKNEEGKPVYSRKTDKVEDVCQSTLQSLSASAKQGGHVDPTLDTKYIDALKKRKFCTVETTKSFTVVKAGGFAAKRRPKALTDMTKDMIQSGQWKDSNFRGYNMNALGQEPAGGQLHPLLKVRQEFREIFLELGFQEMETARFVDSSFWNFDTLFVPQKHPARDAQDTFFISKPENAKKPPQEYLDIVKKAHEDGYKCDFSEAETSRNVLRTHTTANTAFQLYNLAQSSPLCPETGKRLFKPGKYFSIDRVFRNEEMDKTHLCEFHQVEGFIVDRNLSLGHLMHTLDQFFRRVGIEQLRFKPAYNPYTEPSMEIFGYHSGMKRWMELGNSGVFRPEMLKPMGFDDDVSVIAWGLSLERPTMIKYGIKDIHHLFGHKVDLKFIKRAMVARY